MDTTYTPTLIISTETGIISIPIDEEKARELATLIKSGGATEIKILFLDNELKKCICGRIFR